MARVIPDEQVKALADAAKQYRDAGDALIAKPSEASAKRLLEARRQYDAEQFACRTLDPPDVPAETVIVSDAVIA